MRAIGVPVRGRDFPVVWVCTEEEYEQALAAGEEPSGLPWPLDAVKAVASVTVPHDGDPDASATTLAPGASSSEGRAGNE